MTASLDSLLQDARRAVQMAQDEGADAAVAGARWGRSMEHRFRDGKLEKVQEDVSRSLGLQLHVDGRYSAHSTNDLDPDRLRAFVREAVALTRHLQPDPHRAITPPELYAGRASVDLDQVDAGLDGLTRHERVGWCEALLGAAAHDAVISSTAAVLDSYGASARVSSNGFEGARDGTSFWYGAEVTIGDGEKRPEAYRYVGGTHRDGLPAPAEVGAEALRRALLRRGQQKVPSQRTAMVVDPEAGRGLLGRIFGALAGASIQQRRSFLADRLDASIASPVLTMTDDPHRRRSGASRLWDGDGLATRPRAIVERGVLRTFFIDLYYGRKLGVPPTTDGPCNVIFEHGDKDLLGLVADVGEGLYVDSWLGGNANMTTGDFSFGLRGRVIRGGALAEPVSEMNVTGNYLDLLGQLVAVGNDPVPWSSFRTPTLVFDGVQFSGA